MASNKKIAEMMYALVMVVFSGWLFPLVLIQTTSIVGHFAGFRGSKDINIMVLNIERTLVFHSAAGETGRMSVSDIPTDSPITETISRLAGAGKSFNLRIERSTCILHIYNQYAFSNHAFSLKGLPDENKDLGPVEFLEFLNNSHEASAPMTPAMFMTLAYLALNGYLSDRLFVLYKGKMMIIDSHSRKRLFELSLGDICMELGMPINEDAIPDGFLIAFMLDSQYILFFSPENGIPILHNTSDEFKRPFADIFLSDTEARIKHLLRESNYDMLVQCVDDKQRKKARNHLVLLDNSLTTAGFFLTFFPGK